MNKKGFTLVELIAMLVVMGVIMAIAIPNISGIVKSNRESIAVEDVNKMIGNSKQKMETGRAKYPKKDECVVMSLKFLDNNNDFKKGVNDGDYDTEESVIIVAKKALSAGSSTTEYKYFVRLVEVKSSQTYVVDFVDYDAYSKEPTKYSSKLKNFNDAEKLKLKTATKDAIKTKINGWYNTAYGGTLCNSVKEVYSE